MRKSTWRIQDTEEVFSVTVLRNRRCYLAYLRKWKDTTGKGTAAMYFQGSVTGQHYLTFYEECFDLDRISHEISHMMFAVHGILYSDISLEERFCDMLGDLVRIVCEWGGLESDTTA